MIKVPIVQSMRDEAEEYELKMLGSHLKPTYTGIQANRANYYGKLGELAFEYLLVKNDIKFQYDGRKLHFGSDDQDFMVYINEGQPVRLDVKTATQPFHTNLFMPSAQVARHPSDAYVGVRIVDDDKFAEIWGTCTHAELKPVVGKNLPTPTHAVALKKLQPIEKVLARCNRL